MPRALRGCSKPGCPNLTGAGRCDVHATSRDPHSARNHLGIPRQARGHGAEADRYRRELARNPRPCALLLPGCTVDGTSPDYTRPGDWTSPLQPACLRCQRVQGAALARGSR